MHVALILSLMQWPVNTAAHTTYQGSCPAFHVAQHLNMGMNMNIYEYGYSTSPLTKNKLKILLEREKGDSAAVSAE